MIQFGQLFLTLTILITLHEFGHFFFARLFKTKVEKFYLFFDFLFPFAGVLNFSLFKKKIGDTVYGLGWFPFGGYVQIAGMIDEQMDKSVLENAPQPWEFRAKPKWQRLLIMFGGILVNLILGVFIFWMVLFFYGKETVPVANLKHGITCDSLAQSIGFMNGDKIITINSEPVTTVNRVAVDIVMNKAKTVEIERNGVLKTISLSEDDIAHILRNLKYSSFIDARIETEIDSVIGNSPAQSAGLQKGDKLFSLNQQYLPYFDQFSKEIHKHPNQEVAIALIRGNDTLEKKLKTRPDGTIGFYTNTSKLVKVEHFGFFASLGEGLTKGYEALVMQAKQLVVIFTVKDAHQQVGGFYTMYKTLPAAWDWRAFWLRTALFSLVLAFMNFLPVPMLDGGYILFLLIEMITRRNLPEKFIYYANYVGLFLILALMIYANTDWLRQ